MNYLEEYLKDIMEKPIKFCIKVLFGNKYAKSRFVLLLLTRIKLGYVNQRLKLENGGELLLISYYYYYPIPLEEQQRNVYRVNSKGRIEWTVWQDMPLDCSSFTDIFYDEKGRLLAYNFDGFKYKININNGKAYEIEFLK